MKLSLLTTQAHSPEDNPWQNPHSTPPCKTRPLVL